MESRDSSLGRSQTLCICRDSRTQGCGSTQARLYGSRERDTDMTDWVQTERSSV